MIKLGINCVDFLFEKLKTFSNFLFHGSVNLVCKARFFALIFLFFLFFMTKIVKFLISIFAIGIVRGMMFRTAPIKSINGTLDNSIMAISSKFVVSWSSFSSIVLFESIVIIAIIVIGITIILGLFALLVMLLSLLWPTSNFVCRLNFLVRAIIRATHLGTLAPAIVMSLITIFEPEFSI